MYFKILLLLSSIFFNSYNCIKISNSLNIKSMKFNLNKDSLWLSYPLKKTSFKDINKLIPKSHTIAKCKIFKEDKLDYRIFFNYFDVETNFFSGTRLEIITIAINNYDKKPSFIILDCFTDTISWNPIDGIQKANCKIKKKITNSKYDIIINNLNNTENLLLLNSSKSSIYKSVLKNFSIIPNYICYFQNFDTGFKLSFNENQINKKVIILKDISLENNIFKKYIKELEYIFIFPQKMNFKVLF